MKYNYNLILVSLLILTMHSACTKMLPCLQGNGNVVEVTREGFPEFDQIESSGSFDVEVIKDSVRYVEIQAESNLIEFIETKIKNGRLSISIESNHCINNKQPILVIVHVPETNYLGLSGSGTIIALENESNSLEINLSGSGNIETITNANEIYTTISGSGNVKIECEADYLLGTISGSGNIFAEGFAKITDWTIIGSGNIVSNLLEQEESDCIINGSGNINVWATDILKVLINGSGNVIYSGNPDIDLTINGSGTLIKA